MKPTLARIFLGLPGLFILLSGLMFLLNPVGAAEKLMLAPAGAEGLSNIRGFAGASVAAVGASLLLAAITAKLEYARPAAIFLLLLLGARILSYLVDGPIESIGLFLAIPTVAFAFMVAGHKLLVSGEGEAAAGEAGQAPPPSLD